ncbi:HlyD family secretion protein [Ammoniphilus sp. YIM 78166]|uniref:HlyD family secretion protein n=1 Tax=Ammoniphilus sp. YIM 78166 TaxID=1644106 RepID=UPI00106FA772|nr:efflux RND transporter periplasmic adaptor subunit [Ammoniphilus sp. YIM 78166]
MVHVELRDAPKLDRIQQLRKIAKAEHLDFPNNVLEYIVNQQDLNPKAQEDALIRIMAYSAVVNREIDLELAKEALNLVSHNKRFKIQPKRAILATLCSILMLAGCNASDSMGTEAVAPVIETQGEAAKTTIHQDIVLSGRTEPYQEIFLSPAVSGIIKEVYVELGSKVSKGDKLALMFEGDLAHQVRQAEAKVKTVEVNAQIQKIEQQIALNQMKVALSADGSYDIEEVNFAVKQAEIALEDARQNLENNQFLFEQGAIPQVQIEKDQKAVVQAEQQLNRAKQLVIQRSTKASSQKETDQVISKLQQESTLAASKLSKMGVEQAKADLEIIRYRLNNLAVEAPINGYITKKNAVIGASVSQGPMFVITNIDQIYVNVNVPEAMLNKVKVGQTAIVSIPSLGISLEGKITYIAQAANGDAPTFPAKILLNNDNHEIKAGMQAQVSVKSE